MFDWRVNTAKSCSVCKQFLWKLHETCSLHVSFLAILSAIVMVIGWSLLESLGLCDRFCSICLSWSSDLNWVHCMYICWQYVKQTLFVCCRLLGLKKLNWLSSECWNVNIVDRRLRKREERYTCLILVLVAHVQYLLHWLADILTIKWVSCISLHLLSWRTLRISTNNLLYLENGTR